MTNKTNCNPKVYMHAGRKAAEWLVSRQQEDGSIGKPFGVGGMYKTIWALGSAGYINEASKLLDWAKENIMTEPGEFHFKNENEFDRSQYLYRNSFILIGAYKIGRFDIASEKAMDQIIRYQDSSGGFYANLDDKKEENPINLLFTVMGGWTALYFGRINEAIKAGDFILSKILEPQPEFDKIYYVNWDPKSGELVTDFDEEDAIASCIDARRPIGPFYYSGVAAGFLTELFERTGEQRFLEGAKESMSFSFNTMPESYHWPSKCKEGWGAAILFRQVEDPRYRKIAEDVGDITFIDKQLSDGSFGDYLYPMKENGTGQIISGIELTSEFSFELLEIGKGLSNC